MNPEPHLDKVFDNIQYRLDVFKDDDYLANDTFQSYEVFNEYQNGGLLFDLADRGLNIRKKFRI